MAENADVNYKHISPGEGESGGLGPQPLRTRPGRQSMQK